MDRAHLFGQTKDVTVYRLICKETVEENILQRASQKSTVQQLAMTGGHVLGDLLVPEDVISLLVDDTQWEQKLKEIPAQLARDGQKKKGGTKGIWIDVERDASLEDLTNSEPRVIQIDKKVTICSREPSEQGTLQCLGCVKANIPVAKSYCCSPKCFLDAWQHDRVLHEHAANAASENRNEEEELFGRFNNTNTVLAGSQSTTNLSKGATSPLYPAAVAQRSGGETWFEVGRSKTYTPTADDICHVLKFEYVVVDVETKRPVGHANTLLTSSVISASSPSPRCLILVTGVDVTKHLDLDGHVSSEGTFTVLSYNILSDAYATSFPSWAYRRQNLLREIVGYGADIVYRQEVE